MYVDEIASQNFNVSSAGLSCTASRTGCPCYAFFQGGVAFLLYLIRFSLYVEVVFQGESGFFFLTVVVWVLFHLIVGCWSEKIFGNSCHLAASFGTNSRLLIG